MTKAQSISNSPLAKRSKRSSLIAKCTAPFAAKQRSHLEQEIQLDEPFRTYAPGDSVKGAIHVTFGKAIRITHLVVRLHGFVKVFNRAQLPGEELSYDEVLLSLGNGGGRRGTEYFGNGYARLFEDEEVLCGEGRVLGRYEFRFEVVLPSKNMPSSIDFEHGTISYLITSTVTRPTAISPTSVQHLKIRVQENIDIAPIPRPKPVPLSVETSHKKVKPASGGNKKCGAPKSDRTSKSSSHGSTNGLPTLRTVSPQTAEEPPRSPVPSEISSTTATTTSTSSNPVCSAELLPGAVNRATEDIMSVTDPNIVLVKTEVLQGGCLAGDYLPVRISIRHNKVFKCMQGIIVSLYRQGRIDFHPSIPLGQSRKGEKQRFEDCYPKSRTGLGGLSLSSAGSCRSFRQDLAQIVVPIIIDPQSLTSIINTSIEAPPHLFPSITNVPGAMVNFRYFIEIVVDLRGKLSGQDRLRPHLSLTSAPRHGYGDPKVSRWEGSDGVNYHSAPAFNYLITDELRRTKGIVSTRTEVVVGTRDSARKRGKQSTNKPQTSGNVSSRGSVELGREEESDIPTNGDESCDGVSNIQRLTQLRNSNDFRQPTIIPLPEPEEEMDEKAQIRRAEQRLLPSAPPQDGDGPSSSTAPIPSAPPAVDEEDFIHRYGLGPPAPAYEGPPTSFEESGCSRAQVLPARPSAQDDKQELERQRLLVLASSPPNDDDETQGTGDISQAVVPSAPVLFEDDLFSLNDPRIPESSPADFADDRVPLQEQLSDHIKPSAPSFEEGVSHGNDDLQEQNQLADHRIRNNDNPNESTSTNDLDMYNENPPVYRR